MGGENEFRLLPTEKKGGGREGPTPLYVTTLLHYLHYYYTTTMDEFKFINKNTVKSSLQASIKDAERSLEHLKNSLRLLELMDDRINPKQQKLAQERQQNTESQTITARHQLLGKYLQETYSCQEEFDKHRLRHHTSNDFCITLYHNSGLTVSPSELGKLSRKYLMPKVEVVG